LHWFSKLTYVCLIQILCGLTIRNY